MRKTLAVAALGIGLSLSVLPTTSASAYCDAVIYAVTGRCANGCTLVASGYHTADRTAKDLLPDVEFICMA